MRGRKDSGPPDVVLSERARTFHAQLLARGRTSPLDVQQMLGADTQRVVAELQAQFLIYCLPGGDGTRAGRSASYVALPMRPPATPLEMDTVYERLQGQSGTVGGLARKLGWPEDAALAALCALCKQHRAEGAVVGATTVFRIHPNVR